MIKALISLNIFLWIHVFELFSRKEENWFITILQVVILLWLRSSFRSWSRPKNILTSAHTPPTRLSAGMALQSYVYAWKDPCTLTTPRSGLPVTTFYSRVERPVGRQRKNMLSYTVYNLCSLSYTFISVSFHSEDRRESTGESGRLN